MKRIACFTLLALMLAAAPALGAPDAATPKPAVTNPVTVTNPVVTPASAPTSQPAAATAPVVPPVDVSEAAKKAQEAIEAAQKGQWWYFSSLVCLILMFILKAVGVLKKMGRWKYVVLPILSLAAALLAAFQGGVTLSVAAGVFGSSWAMGMLEELVNHGILGKPHETAGGTV